MDNIKDENLQRLGKYIANALIDNALSTNKEDWIETNIKDHLVGEYEKCAIMKLRIQDITSSLNVKGDLDINLEENDEN